MNYITSAERDLNSILDLLVSKRQHSRFYLCVIRSWDDIFHWPRTTCTGVFLCFLNENHQIWKETMGEHKVRQLRLLCSPAQPSPWVPAYEHDLGLIRTWKSSLQRKCICGVLANCPFDTHQGILHSTWCLPAKGKKKNRSMVQA